MEAALKKGYWWNKELEKDLSKPPGAGQADARAGFAGAIPTGKDGSLHCEGVGATCEADKVLADEAKEKKDEKAAKDGDEANKEAEKILKEEAEKKAKGDKPKEETVPAELAGAEAAPAAAPPAFG